MADCCAELRREVQLLRKEIAALGNVDEEKIVKKAVKRSEESILPSVAALGLVMQQAQKQLNILQKLLAFLQAAIRPLLPLVPLILRVLPIIGGIATLLATIAFIKSQIDGINGAISKLRVEINRIKDTATKALGKAVDASGKASNAQYRVGTVEAQLRQAEARLRAQIKTAETRLDNKIESLRKGLQAEIQKTREQLNAEIASARNELRYEFRTRDAELKASIAQAEANFQSKISQLEANYKAADAQLDRKISEANLSSKLAANKAQLALDKANSFNVAIDRLNYRVGNNEAVTRDIIKQLPDIKNTANTASFTATAANKQANFTFDAFNQYKRVWNPTVADVKITNAVTRVRDEIRPISIAEASNAIKKSFNDITAANASALAPTFDKKLEQNKAEITNFINQGLNNSRIETDKKIAAIEPIKAGDFSNINLEIAKLNFRLREREAVDAKATKDLEEIKGSLANFVPLLAGITASIRPIALNTSPDALRAAAAAGVCQTTQPGGCTSNLVNNAANNVNQNTNRIGNVLGAGNAAANAEQLRQLADITTRLGAPIPGGLSGGLGRLSKFLGIDRLFNLLNFLATLHNASMLSASLKITLLETLSSVGNATGLLQTSEGDNVDLNQVFNKGIESFIVAIVGVETWANFQLTWRKHNSIFRSLNNAMSNIGNMFSSIGNGIEIIGERSGKIGNALRAAGVVRENAYNFMSENMDVHTSKYMTFQTTVGGVTQILDGINELAENVIEGQQSYTEAVKATDEFKKALAEGTKEESKDAQNKAIAAEAAKIKENLIKDPTGEDEEGLLSFLTDR